MNTTAQLYYSHNRNKLAYKATFTDDKYANITSARVTSLAKSPPFGRGLKKVFTVAPSSWRFRFAVCKFDFMSSVTSYNPEAATFTSREHTLHLADCSPALLCTNGPCIYRFFLFRFQICERKTDNEFLFRFSFSNLRTKNEKRIRFSFFVFKSEVRKTKNEFVFRFSFSKVK